MMMCPNCNLEINFHINADSLKPVTPEMADLGICFSCGQAMIFDGEKMLAFNKPDWEALSVMQRLQLHWNWVKWNLNHSIRGN